MYQTWNWSTPGSTVSSLDPRVHLGQEVLGTLPLAVSRVSAGIAARHDD